MVHYYLKEQHIKNQPIKSNVLSKNYIIIQGIKFHIEVLNASYFDIIFTNPVLKGGIMFSDHFHFVKQDFVIKGKGLLLTSGFHKTLQNNVTNAKEHYKCYFRDKSRIYKIDSVVCDNSRTGNIMTDVISEQLELAIIYELIARPFVNIKIYPYYIYRRLRW